MSNVALPTISERYERLRREAEVERSARHVPRVSLPSLGGVSRFLAGSRVHYNADAHATWKAHTMVGTVLGFHFKPGYRDKHIYLPADWLVRVKWDDDDVVENNVIHPDWLEIVQNPDNI